MGGLLLRADGVLRTGTPALRGVPRVAVSGWTLVLIVVVFGAGYGAAMGSYGGRAGFAGVRPLQMFYSAVKVPVLLLGTFALSLPSYFVLSSLLGLRGDLAAAAGDGDDAGGVDGGVVCLLRVYAFLVRQF